HRACLFSFCQSRPQKCFAIATFATNYPQMLSLRKLLGKDDKFFDLLEAGAEEAKASVDLFTSYLQKTANGTMAGSSLDDFIQTRRKEKRIRHTMTEELSKTFVTPLEREDIEALSFALYRIPKQV